MDSLGPGEAGVLDWCNSIRLHIAKDPGREFVHTQLQTQGFDFLDSYLENVFSREEEEPVYQLLKTPGKKKDAGKRTRAAMAATAKLKAINSMMLDELDTAAHVRTATGSSSSSQSSTSSKPQPTTTKKKTQRIVTIVDTPEPPKMDVDEEHTPPAAREIPAPQFLPPHAPSIPAALPVPQHPPSLELPSTSRQSDSLVQPAPSAPEPTSTDEHILVDDMHTLDATDAAVPAVPEYVAEEAPPHPPTNELSMIAEADEPSDQSRLSPVRPAEPREDDKMEEDEEVPIRDVPHDPMDQDLTVPLRDVPGPTTLKRKPSMSTFSGLPAPSPLRKSMRMSHEPSGNSVFPSLAHTPGAGLGSAGKRTSWLTQAKQAKALEFGSGKRVAGATAAAAAVPAGKAKSSEPFGLDFALPTPPAVAEEDRAPESEALAFLREKRKAASLEDNTTRVVPLPQQKAQPSPPPVASDPVDDFADDMAVPLNDQDGEEHTLHRLKLTVEGARAGKSTGKSLGGNAAAELAEARAKAEAKIAQRNKGEGEEATEEEQNRNAAPQNDAPKRSLSPIADPSTKPRVDAQLVEEKRTPVPEAKVEPVAAEDPSRRMSLSDLMSDSERSRTQTETKGKPADLSTSTTPPNSPPVMFSKGKATVFVPAPVFSKPPTVFVPPPPRPPKEGLPPSTSKEPVFTLPVAGPFSFPATTLGVPATFHAQKLGSALSAQSSKATVLSDAVFEKEAAVPAWMTATQDTELSPAQPFEARDEGDADMDEDDSWHVDEKFQANQTWTPFGFGGADRDDTMTWSTLPSRSTSQKGGDTGPLVGESLGAEAHRAANEMLEREKDRLREDEGEAAYSEADRAQEEINEEDLQSEDMEIDEDYAAGVDTELEDIVATGKATISLVKQPPRAPSQQSMASTSSSQSQQSQPGFFGQASRLMSSVLGSSKTKKAEPVKSIARAAAVAKKQQEEADKKAARMKDMENRRQQAQQRKADEEKARAQEAERKTREEAERRKREKDEHTDKRPLKPTKKADDDTTKRKLNAEAEKKAGPVKPPSKDGQSSRTLRPPSANGAPTVTKIGPPLKSALSKQASTTSLAAAASSSAIPKVPASEPKPSKIATSSSNPKLAAGKGKAKAPADKEDELPSKVLQTQMANRAKAQMQAVQTPRAPPPVTSESIELPDINSEYSDSEDEGRPRTFDPPDWAQSPELRQQLETQSRINPDSIFGPIVPLRMEEIFRTRQSRFRARTSSANWAGTDELTADEQRDYARRMGYR